MRNYFSRTTEAFEDKGKKATLWGKESRNLQFRRRCPLNSLRWILSLSWTRLRLVMLHLSPQNFSKEVSRLKHLAKVNMINIDVENMIRRKLIIVTLDRTKNLTPCPGRATKRNKFMIFPLLSPLTSKLNSNRRVINFRLASTRDKLGRLFTKDVDSTHSLLVALRQFSRKLRRWNRQII